MSCRALLLLFVTAVVFASPRAAWATGAAIVFTSDRTYVPNLYIVNADGSDQLLLLEGAENPQWSPDGSRLAYQNDDGELLVGRPDGSEPKTIGSFDTYGVYGWAPDGSRIAYAAGGIFVTAVASGTVSKITDDDSDQDPSWSPDGSGIAFERGFDTAYTVIPDGSGLREIGPGTDPKWSPNGETIALIRDAPETNHDQLWLVRPDGTGARQIGPTGDPDIEFSWSPDGAWVAIDTGERILVVDVATGKSRELDRELRDTYPYNSAPAWSPDGTHLAASGNDDLWVFDAETGARERITNANRYGYENGAPSWDPVGRSTAEIGGSPVTEALPPSSILRDGVVETAAPITGLSADGQLVAIELGVTETICPHGEIWNPAGGTITALRWSVGCWGGESARIVAFSFAGSQHTRATIMEANHSYPEVETASLDEPRAMSVSPFVPVSYAALLAGDGDLTVLAHQPDKGGAAELWRIEGTRATRLVQLTERVRSLAVDSGRIATNSQAGVTLRRSDGRAYRRIRPALAVKDIALDTSQLAILTRSALLSYDVTTGHREEAWPLPPHATKKRRLLDMFVGIAVYREGRTLHALRISDGRDIIVASPSHGPVYAQIESSGLFYSYNEPGVELKGRVVFIPFDELLERIETP